MGLLKSRKDGSDEPKRYVDVPAHAPRFDDVSEEEFLDSDGVQAQVSMSIEALQAQVAARNARLNAAMVVAATGQPEVDAAAAAARGQHARMLGELLVGRGVLNAEQLVAALDGQAATGQRLG